MPDSTWDVVITPRAAKQLQRLSLDAQARVLQALERLKSGPFVGDVRKLEGKKEATWRLRVGEYRVKFGCDFPVQRIVVLGVLPRRDAYRN